MEYFAQSVPLWLTVAFVIAIPFPILLIAHLAKKGASQAEGLVPNRVRNFILLFYTVFLVYTSIACFAGQFAAVSLPPRILLFTMIPLLFLFFGLVFHLPITKKILEASKLSDLIRVHIFRLIGAFFLLLFFYDFLPKTFALIAGIGDITTALTALLVGRWLDQKKSFARPVAFLWNTFGLCDILATSFTAFWLTKLSIEQGIPGVDVLTLWPYCFIPAYAPATIIFLHVCIYRKLLKRVPHA